MSVTRARHTIPDIRPSTTDTYIEKACIERSVIRGRATHIIGVANYILAGFVEQVEDAHGVEECIAACYMALKRYGFHCMSAMWYPLDKDQNCLLNGESRRSQPNLFIPEDTGHQMIYFEHPDAAVFKRMHDELPAEQVKTVAIWQSFGLLSIMRTQQSTRETGWTAWSLCSSKEERIRYAKCKEHADVRKCPKETQRYNQCLECFNLRSASLIVNRSDLLCLLNVINRDIY
ncbi:PAN domain protein [Oesophagostomum dentatum]|uniref:PAN domain protein n=1 Tax=Oesophagostomum dentatum TaxID=61180 RepID=A0A0B1TNZ7_OESDE|nr:PAN domain protein [Oesophagostomum dentatum]